MHTIRNLPRRLGARSINIAEYTDTHTDTVYIVGYKTMYTSCTTVHMIKTCTGCIYISTLQVVLKSILQARLTDSRGGKNQIFCGRPEWEACLQLLLSCWSEPAWLQRHALLCLYFVAIVCVELCDPLFGLLFHYLSKKKERKKNKRRKKTCCTCVPSKEKAKWEPSVRCYKLLARPVARPREPDLAAPRLRRVKHCTQRSSLHLYAPYIGRLLLQPTSTWLLAS